MGVYDGALVNVGYLRLPVDTPEHTRVSLVLFADHAHEIPAKIRRAIAGSLRRACVRHGLTVPHAVMSVR